MLRRLLPSRRSFHGGMFLPLHHDETADASLRVFPMPRRLRVPLVFPDGTGCVPEVRRDQLVEQHEILGRSEGEQQLVIRSPAAGKVTALGRVDTAHTCDLPAVEIRTAEPNSESWWEEKPLDEPDPCTLEVLAERAGRAGAFSGGSPREPLALTLHRLANQRVHTIIVNGLEAEPYVTSTRRHLIEHMDEVLATATWLRRATGARRLRLAVDRDDRTLLRHSLGRARGTPVGVCGLVNKYPAGHPILLTKILTGQIVPYGRAPLDIGVWVLDAADLEALRGPAPMISRVVSVSGAAVARPGNYRIPLGTSCADILLGVGLRESVGAVVDGGPMTGRAIPSLDRVITQETRSVLTIERSEVLIKRPGPCIRCGWCLDDCPVQLDPRAILDAVEREDWQQAGSLYPQACLECGLCSYVCPSELPLAEAARNLKRMEAG